MEQEWTLPSAENTSLNTCIKYKIKFKTYKILLTSIFSYKETKRMYK